MSNLESFPDHVRQTPVPLDQCPMSAALSLLGDRWTLLILREAFYGVVRFADMQADMDVSRATLSERLSRLVEAGVLEKGRYREPGARTRPAYSLTPRGRALAPVLIAMSEWGEAYLADAPNPVIFIDRETGQSVHVGLVTGSGQPVALENLSYRIRDRDENSTSPAADSS